MRHEYISKQDLKHQLRICNYLEYFRWYVPLSNL